MEIYHGKLMELVSIEKEYHHSYLQINLSMDQDELLFWEIDHETAENLRAATTFDDDKYMYRLSFHSWESGENQYISYVTRTYREQSDKIYFSCSKEYKNNLSAIKRIYDSSKLHSLPFLMSKIPGNDGNNEAAEKQRQEQAKSGHHSLAWFSVAVITAICITLVLYVGNSDLIKTVFAQKQYVNAVSKEKVIRVESQKEAVEPSVKKQAPTQHSITKFFTLDLQKNSSYSVPDGYVALTFDDGPSRYSKEIVDILKKYHVGGTFFYIGQNVKKYPESVQYTHKNGFVIGNHSMTHPEFTKLSYEKQERELLETNQLIKQITHEPVRLFRPPYGSIDNNTRKLLNNHHYKMVLWNKDPRDWQNHDPKKIVHYIKSNHPSGSIIILHESEAVVDALPSIINYLESQKIKIVNLE
ncbi:polysaccharide deacetylase family protein [Bacillus sp. FJAT-49736]|uniref:polysaccharide deacetylase family protein n=1 Tax=Bacillus sp. FJAT-49736 TaxID=2833582 RepID=UPI001BC90626|nr:polysaccharide deacetylase family protein [Bacillus sp. FJAT-49736]MBS4174283.1 polysaccharide deacetylase family protein [Bacillus sp. FJAT-49736]